MPTTEENLAILFVVGAIFLMSVGGAAFLFTGGGIPVPETTFFSKVFSFSGGFFSFIRQVFMVLVVFSLVVISYALVKLLQVYRQTKFVFPGEVLGKEATGRVTAYEAPENKHWVRIQKLFVSDSPSDWKIAILEADIMLDDMVRSMGYTGETLGECLKQIERSDFTTLDFAWEAHNFRNKIAHEPDANISRRDINRVIGLFEKVFREFSYI